MTLKQKNFVRKTEAAIKKAIKQAIKKKKKTRK